MGQSNGGTFHPVLHIKTWNCAWKNPRPGSFYHVNVSVYRREGEGGVPDRKDTFRTCVLHFEPRAIHFHFANVRNLSALFNAYSTALPTKIWWQLLTYLHHYHIHKYLYLIHFITGHTAVWLDTLLQHHTCTRFKQCLLHPSIYQTNHPLSSPFSSSSPSSFTLLPPFP